jgi:hypothetical protein
LMKRWKRYQRKRKNVPEPTEVWCEHFDVHIVLITPISSEGIIRTMFKANWNLIWKWCILSLQSNSSTKEFGCKILAVLTRSRVKFNQDYHQKL